MSYTTAVALDRFEGVASGTATTLLIARGGIGGEEALDLGERIGRELRDALAERVAKAVAS